MKPISLICILLTSSISILSAEGSGININYFSHHQIPIAENTQLLQNTHFFRLEYRPEIQSGSTEASNTYLASAEPLSDEIFLATTLDSSTKVDFSNTVYINSIPYGAHIKSSSEHIGITPLYLSYDKYWGKRLQLVKEGYEPYEFILKGKDPVVIRLREKEGEAQLREKPDLSSIAPKKYTKTKFALLATTVVSHWASFYFKNQADKEFQKYLTSADPDEMKKHQDRTKQFDRLSEVALGISFTSLAGLIYLVVFH